MNIKREKMNKNIKITTLVEDTAEGNGLHAEHGVSFWIEYGDSKLLFDTGQTGIVVKNAEILGIDLAQADAIVISHGHYDHTGGLEPVLNQAKKAKLYLHPDALDKKYSFTGGTSRFIGVAHGIKSIIESHSQTNKVVWTKGPTEIFPGLFVTGEVPRTNDFEIDENEFFLDEKAKKPDILADDQSVFFNTANGLVVIFGCAHAGLINTLDYVTKISRTDKIYAIIGGMHLIGAKKERIQKVINRLKSLNLQKIGPAHCTGLKATLEIRQAFPRKCFICSAGTIVEY